MQVTKFDRTLNVKFWNFEDLGSLIAIDTETELIKSPAIVPKLILTTVYSGENDAYVVKTNDLYNFLLMHNHSKLVFWNAAFDIPVIQNASGYDLVGAVLDGDVLDGQILYRLLNIAEEGKEASRWALDHVTESLLKEILAKDDDIRLTFGQYIDPKTNDVIYDHISAAHLEYAILDAVATFLIYEKLKDRVADLPTTTNLAHTINLLGDMALSQVTRNGIAIDQEKVEMLNSNLEVEKVKNEQVLQSYGYYIGKKGNTKVIESICNQQGFKMPVTETGKMSTSKASLELYKDHPFVESYLQYKGFNKQKNFLNNLLSPVVHPRYNSIKVTGRSSCTKPNIQQMPRIGGIRECFIPHPGHVFLDVDYAAIELAAISAICQHLFGKSVMADLINADKDLHKYAASQIYKVPESDVSKEQRQIAKILNFGLVANMAPSTFVGHASKFGLKLSEDESAHLKQQWVKVFPEMNKYWNRARGKSTVITDTGFIRGNCSYTEFLNTPMQGKVAEGAKIALFNLLQSGYKVVGFIHDQVLISHPIEGAEAALVDVCEIMISSMKTVIKGVKVSVDGKIKTRFEK